MAPKRRTKRRQPSRGALSPIDRHYLNQTAGYLPFYSGSYYQRGRGLGSIFRSLIRHVTPVASYLGKRAAAVGKDLFKDFLRGRDLRTAAKRRLIQEGTSVARDVIRKRVPKRYVERLKSILPEDEDIFHTPPSK